MKKYIFSTLYRQMTTFYLRPSTSGQFTYSSLRSEVQCRCRSWDGRLLQSSLSWSRSVSISQHEKPDTPQAPTWTSLLLQSPTEGWTQPGWAQSWRDQLLRSQNSFPVQENKRTSQKSSYIEVESRKGDDIWLFRLGLFLSIRSRKSSGQNWTLNTYCIV